MAEQLIERDREINTLDEDIAELVVFLISTQQPVASDLRKIVATLIHHNLLELLDLMPDKKAECIQLSFVLRYIERIGDHVTNLAEAIIYIVSGKRVDLNP